MVMGFKSKKDKQNDNNSAEQAERDADFSLLEDGEAATADGSESSDNGAASDDNQDGNIQELKAALEEALKGQEDYKDKYIRSLADFENFKKRSIKERSEMLKYQGERVFVDILEVVDNLELAIQYSEADAGKLRDGIKMIYKILVDILGRWEVRSESGIGKDFDPSKHAAISKVVLADAKPGTITNELKKTYFFKDKLLRPGEVVVAMAPEVAAEPEVQSAESDAE